MKVSIHSESMLKHLRHSAIRLAMQRPPRGSTTYEHLMCVYNNFRDAFDSLESLQESLRRVNTRNSFLRVNK